MSVMKESKWLLALCVLLFGGISIAYLFLLGQNETENLAEKGVLDLRGGSFQEEVAMQLNGEWLFQKGAFVDPIDGDWSESLSQPVPHNWARDEQLDSPFGYGSYRLIILADQEENVIGLKTNSIRMAHRLFFNGELIGSSGAPGETKESTKPGNTPYTVYVPLEKGKNTIVLHVANYYYMAGGGLTSPMYIGSQEAISSLRDRSLMHDWVVVTALLVMGLYLLGMYMQRKTDRSLLFFSLFCFAQMVFSGLHGEKVLYMIWPDLPYSFVLRMQLLSPVSGNVLLYFYLYYAFPSIRPKMMLYMGAGIGAAGTLYCFLSPSAVPYGLMVMSPLYSLLSAIYFIYILSAAFWQREEGAMYLLIGLIVFNIYGISHTANVFGLSVLDYFPLEVILFILMMALLLSLRFSNAFKKVDALSQELLKIDKHKDEFLAKTSHEFKTPVHGIMNIAESIVKDAKNSLSKEQLENITLISATARRLSVLVNDMLDLSKLKRGELDVHILKVDVRGSVDLILDMYTFLIEEKKLIIVNDVPDNLPSVLADEVRFRQIMINLLDNAMKHTNHGMIRITAFEESGRLAISIEDTGEGIGAEQLNTIFEPYRQFHEATSYKGAGLGLSIVRQLLEVQRGSIKVASQKGEGSTFTFYLPIDSSVETKGKPAADPSERYMIHVPYESSSQSGPSILVVDDHDVNLKILIELLEGEGYKVTAVKSGEEAVQLISRKQVDLMIVDLMMPGMSGFDVCRHIRKRYSAIQLPILIVTASHHKEEKITAFQAGATDFLPKPFDLSELKVRVANLVALKQAAAENATMEVAFLQSQIKPHFLFNVLNTIHALTYMDAEQARQVIDALARYLRGSFDFHNTEQLVPIEKELALIQTYVSIEQARFRNKVRAVYDIPDELSLRLPPLLLQPLVENAIRHGISKRIDGGTVRLSITQEQDKWKIVIEDDGVGIPPEVLEKIRSGTVEGKGIGLKNINRRLQYISYAAWTITSELNKGTKIVIILQKETGM